MRVPPFAAMLLPLGLFSRGQTEGCPPPHPPRESQAWSGHCCARDRDSTGCHRSGRTPQTPAGHAYQAEVPTALLCHVWSFVTSTAGNTGRVWVCQSEHLCTQVLPRNDSV